MTVMKKPYKPVTINFMWINCCIVTNSTFEPNMDDPYGIEDFN